MRAAPGAATSNISHVLCKIVEWAWIDTEACTHEACALRDDIVSQHFTHVLAQLYVPIQQYTYFKRKDID